MDMIKGRGVVDSGFVDTPESPLTSEWNIPAERDEDIRRRDVWMSRIQTSEGIDRPDMYGGERKGGSNVWATAIGNDG